MRLTSLVLIDAAMGYRETFYREDIEAQLQMLNEQVAASRPLKATIADDKRAEKKIKALNLDFKEKNDRLNKFLYEYIESVTKTLSEDQYKAFDNMKVVFGLMAEEIIKSPDRTKLLTVARICNEGHLDYLFEQVNKQENENNNEIIADNDHLRIPNGAVQEEGSDNNPSIDYNKPSSGDQSNGNTDTNGSNVDNGHQQSGDVQDAKIVNLIGAEQSSSPDTEVQKLPSKE